MRPYIFAACAMVIPYLIHVLIRGISIPGVTRSRSVVEVTTGVLPGRLSAVFETDKIRGCLRCFSTGAMISDGETCCLGLKTASAASLARGIAF